uniref:diacylglycerol kinase (ATP) n=1 Tax=Tetraselmis sp. GSL018 TaxID=582737 RepID=A0A061RH00_9CHLO|mmetsp:Transcript_14555/g.34589  ORF Transcript_14555/g.34589 Transcript_14555/m.34589 type:complete len:299 (-) Transcript_14555:184-1080(-)
MGTGNDLARCLNWGGGMHAVRECGLPALMAEIQRAAVVLLDRWSVRISPLGDGKGQEAAVSKSMNNYVGIGVDAKAALDFHNTRNQYPAWFQSQLGNKMWYGVVGASDLIGHSCAALPLITTLEVDGRRVALPDDIEGLMILNITSYMGGVNLWTCGRAPEGYAANRPPGFGGGAPAQSMSDGIIEVVAVYGTWHLGQLQVGMAQAQRLARGRHIRLRMEGTLPMQIDGEPWMQGPAVLDVSCMGQAFMLRRLKSSSAGLMANIVAEALDNCESKGILTTAQRQAVIAELASRLGTMP